VYWKFTQATPQGAAYPHPSGDTWSDWAKFANDSGDSYYGMDASSRFKPRPGKNDTQSSAHVIPLLTGSGSYEFWGVTDGYGNDNTAACGAGAGSPDAAYSLHLDSRSRVELSLAGSLYDTVLVVKNVTSGAEVGCNDDSNNTYQSALNLTLEPGDYVIYVDGYSTSNTGAYKLAASVTPLNDTVATAYQLPPHGGTFTGTTNVLNNDFTGCLGDPWPDAVYRLSLSRTQRVQLNTLGSFARTSLAVMRADGTFVTCSPRHADGISRLDITLSPGTYDIYLDAELPSQGTHQLNVNLR
jgi:hypothetical protein